MQYLSNRSLWFDEVSLALNLLERDYFGLLRALDYNQAAPPLFLWIEKFLINTWGGHEYALRLFPLLGGLLSLGLYYRFTQQFSRGWVRVIAIWLFSLQGYIVYFSGETKPYSWDVALGIWLFMLVMALDTIKPSLQKLLTASAVGAVSIWLAFPSIFVMAGIEGANIVKLRLWRESWQQIKAFLIRRLALYSIWVGSFCCLYFGIIQSTLAETGLSDSWAGRYPDSWLDGLWLLDSMGRFFYRPMGFSSPADGIALVAFLAGLVCLYRTRRLQLLYLGAPFIANLVASYLHKYPFRERLVLYLVPFGLIILAEGIVFWCDRINKRPRILGIISVIMAVSLVVMPIGKSLQDIVRPTNFHFDHVRPAMAYIQKQWQPGDKLYVFTRARPQFQYYNYRFEFSEQDTFLSKMEDIGIKKLEGDDLDQYEQELSALKAGPLAGQSRVWLLLARKKPHAENDIVERINQVIVPLERKQFPGAMVGLYDFS
ncbi:MAG: hypothetical protein AAF821_20585 [Cyanobacteria bacterium P01_D01_bin.156]